MSNQDKLDKFYVAGGSMNADALSYIKRDADDKLYNHLNEGDFCYILTPRQMGKSSLMIRTAKKLEEKGVHTAIVDLSLSRTKYEEQPAEKWYNGIEQTITSELKIKVNLNDWRNDWKNLPISQRLSEFFKKIVLESTKGKIVIFIDEIDSTISQPFTDGFFAAIRNCYNERARDSNYDRLSFALLGVASPSDLIKDFYCSPFNIGQEIDLSDFTFNQSTQLLSGLGANLKNSDQTLERILHWTGGHPYLTQKLFKSLAEKKAKHYTNEIVDENVNDIFLKPEVIRKDWNLDFVRKCLTEDPKYNKEILKLYRRICQGKTVINNPDSLIHAAIKLSGLIIQDANILKVRNNIYKRVFTLDWIKEEQKRIARITFPIFIQNAFNVIENKFMFSIFYDRYIKELENQNRFSSLKSTTIRSVFSFKLQKIYIDISLSHFNNEYGKSDNFNTTIRYSIWELLERRDDENKVLVLLGKPGAGKTALLQHIIMEIVSKNTSGKIRKYIPFQLSVSKFIEDIVNQLEGSEDLVPILEENLKKLKPPIGWCRSFLTRYGSRCIVMMDGLDEIAEQTMRAKVARWIEKQTEKYLYVRFIITSRPFGYLDNPIERAAVLEINDFTLKQVKEFIKKWYKEIEVLASREDDEGIIREANEKANDLINKIYISEVLSKLSLSPLLLTMICLIHYNLGDVNQMRAFLYAEVCKVFLSGRASIFSKKIKLNIFQKQAILQRLAFYMMINETNEIPVQDAIAKMTPLLRKVSSKIEDKDARLFLNNMINESGLLVKTEKEKIRFVHLTYQEYLAAVEFKNPDAESKKDIKKDNLKEDADIKELENYLIIKIGDIWWHETILLYSALSDATKFIKTCLDATEDKSKNLKLAYEISQEAMKIDPDIRAKLQKMLLYEAESDVIEKQEVAANLMFEIRLKNMISISGELQVDPFFISRVEYQSYINDKGIRPDHWPEDHFSPKDGLKPIVGVRYRDAEKYSQWLTQRAHKLGYKTSYFRLPGRGELNTEITNIEIDPNFKELASENIGAWIYDMEYIVFDSINNLSELRRFQILKCGENEIQRIEHYHKLISKTIEKILYEIDSLLEEIDEHLLQLDKNVNRILSGMSDRAEKLLIAADQIKKNYDEFEKFAQNRHFSFYINKNMIEDLDSELIALSRLPYIRFAKNVYTVIDKTEIIDLLSATKKKLSWLQEEIKKLLNKERQNQKRFFNKLSENLRQFAGNPIDLDKQLSFLNNLKDINLGTDKIRSVNERSSKNYERARSELLALAEYHFNCQQFGVLNEIIQAFWAIFIIEQRSKKEKPIPAWEGIRLVREIKPFTEISDSGKE